MALTPFQNTSFLFVEESEAVCMSLVGSGKEIGSGMVLGTCLSLEILVLLFDLEQ